MDFNKPIIHYTFLDFTKHIFVIISLFTFLTGFTVPSNAAGKLDKATGTMKGTVQDAKGNPLPAVNVSLPQLSMGSVTDVNGHYVIKEVPQGTYTLVFSLIGYSRKTQRVTVEPEQTLTVNATLKETVLESEAVTVTGSAYASDPLKTAADVDALSGRAKLSKETASLGATLEDMPGVTNISTGSQVGKPVIRGLSGNRVRVMTDGTPMDYQQFGVRHMPNVDPVLSDRIEVVRGASSVLYGSDALGGAVNIIPNHVPSPTGNHASISGEVISSYATNNNERMGAFRLDGIKNGFGYTGTLVRRVAGDITTPNAPTYVETGNSTSPKFTGTLDHTNYEQLNGNVGLGYTGDFGKVDAHYTRWTNRQNFLLPDGSGEGQNLENDMVQVNGLYSQFNRWLIRTKFTYAHNLRQAGEAGTTLDKLNDQTIALDLSIDSYTGRLELEHSPIGIFSGQMGMEVMHQDQHTRGVEPLVPSSNIDNIGWFIFEKTEFGPITLSGGARFDLRRQKAHPNAAMNLPNYANGETDAILKQNYQAFSGSLGATWSLMKHLSLAANLGRGFRAPSIFELHAEGVHGGVAAYQIGNPHLHDEISFNTDLSLRWQSEKVKAKATIYRNMIDHYIYLSETSETRDGLPVWLTTQGNARLIGGDASISAQPLSWLRMSGSFETVRGKIRSTGDALPMLPADNLEGELRFMQKAIGKLSQPYLKVKLKYAASKKAAGSYEPFSQFDQMPFGTASTDAYTLLNVGIGFDFPLLQHYSTFDLTVSNVLNTTYRDFLDTYKGYALGAGRNIQFRVSIPFDIQK